MYAHHFISAARLLVVLLFAPAAQALSVVSSFPLQVPHVVERELPPTLEQLHLRLPERMVRPMEGKDVSGCASCCAVSVLVKRCVLRVRCSVAFAFVFSCLLRDHGRQLACARPGFYPFAVLWPLHQFDAIADVVRTLTRLHTAKISTAHDGTRLLVAALPASVPAALSAAVTWRWCALRVLCPCVRRPGVLWIVSVPPLCGELIFSLPSWLQICASAR
jgi:hypothetical protein